ncbi:MAG TPA: NmrA family NAD(P)-binding protein [Anaerolineales bacterium]|nr:NmrA family NAD(P)-binding protein [Anaerolineales bacterium]
MILVTGAGGKTGRTLIRVLSQVESVSALVHREEHISTVKSLGAGRVVVGDMRDEMAMRSGMEGVRAVYHLCPNMDPDEMVIGKLVIEEARRAEVKHFIYHSVLHPQTEKMHHHWQKLRVEEMIFESGLPFTILQPAPYMQNLLASWRAITEEGIVKVPYSIHAEFSFVDLQDIAEAARVVLTEPGHINAIYELAGTAPTSHVQFAEIFEGVLNRPVRAEQEDLHDWNLRAGHLGEYARGHLVRMFEYYDRWGLAGNPNVLGWLLKRKPGSLEDFIRRTVREQHAIH